MTRPIQRSVICLTLALTVVAAGCSSSAKKSPPSSPPGGTQSATSTQGGSLTSADKTAISRAFAVFFNTDTSLAASMKVLQNGPAFRQALITETNSPGAQHITASVSSVVAKSANLATVTFTL